MQDKRKSKEISLVVNGNNVKADSKAHTSLLNFLRNELQLTGCKQGCSTGHCGACNVLINGRLEQACQVSLSAAERRSVETIEAIVQSPPGQQITSALIQHDAAQCGYCLPGIVVAACAEMLCQDSPDPQRALKRNLCRCGTNSRILVALTDAMANSDAST